VGVSNTLSHRVDIPNSVFETYLLFARSGIHVKISNLKQGPDSILIFPRDADAIIFTFHALNSLFERHSNITFQLYKKNLLIHNFYKLGNHVTYQFMTYHD